MSNMNENPEALRWDMGDESSPPYPHPDGDWVRYENYERLKAENEALRRDAERYRWLRTNCYSDKYPYSEFDSAMQLSFTVSGIWANNRDPSVLDGCLDTAMGDKT